ncbi:YdgA family protein [Gammaproteobacteria bacterium]|nr:YdgA family protein [Gammaproteobacteria bacterium]MDB9859720.1 YdgA family protein [Gammaproteobacteria bacterium]MDB9939893.1 YdgA family protein [Gammaproteobacteria bacterium]
MKKLLTLAILIAVILLAGSKIIGNSVNQNLNDFITNLNEIPGYQLKIINLESGWFTTTAEVNIGLDPVMLNDGSMDLEEELIMKQLLNADFNITAQHGPLLTLNGFGLGFLAFNIEVDDFNMREYLKFPENQPLYSIKGRTSFFGATSFIDSMPSFAVIDLANFRFDGWSGQGQASSDKVAYKGEMPSLMFIDEDLSLEITSITINFDYDTSISEIMTNMFVDSKGEFNIGSVRVSDASMDFALKNLGVSMISEVDKNEDLMDYAVNYSAEAISALSFKANDLMFNFELNNLEKSLLDFLEEIIGKDPLEIEQAMLDLQEQDIDEKKKFLLPILQASPEFNLTKMSGNIGSGNFSGYVKTKLTDIENLPDAPEEDMAWWLSKIVIDSKLTLNTSMAREIDHMFQLGAEAMIEAGMLTKNSDGDFDLIFRLQDSTATLNDDPFPLPF